MNIPDKDPTDDELADMMDDSDSAGDSDSSEGAVEMGVPPEIEDSDPSINTEEESFSMDDFDSDLSSSDPPASESDSQSTESISDENVEVVPDPEVADSMDEFSSSSPPIHEEEKLSVNGANGVAEFRQSLANLSRQIEIDRLALLHKSLSAKGETLPSLSQIADDIHGRSALSPDGDCDQYSKRPSARLDGWVSGLSFGASRRAKKFTK